MKLIKVFIHHVRSVEVVQALADAGHRNITLQDVKGMLKPLNDDERDFSGDASGLVISETQISLVCEDQEVTSIIDIVRKIAPIGPNVSGWLYVSSVEQVVQIGGP